MHEYISQPYSLGHIQTGLYLSIISTCPIAMVAMATPTYLTPTTHPVVLTNTAIVHKYKKDLIIYQNSLCSPQPQNGSINGQNYPTTSWSCVL